jgi:hypothetical protein
LDTLQKIWSVGQHALVFGLQPVVAEQQDVPHSCWSGGHALGRHACVPWSQTSVAPQQTPKQPLSSGQQLPDTQECAASQHWVPQGDSPRSGAQHLLFAWSTQTLVVGQQVLPQTWLTSQHFPIAALKHVSF